MPQNSPVKDRLGEASAGDALAAVAAAAVGWPLRHWGAGTIPLVAARRVRRRAVRD